VAGEIGRDKAAGICGDGGCFVVVQNCCLDYWNQETARGSRSASCTGYVRIFLDKIIATRY
jgi:hypothetical protein